MEEEKIRDNLKKCTETQKFQWKSQRMQKF